MLESNLKVLSRGHCPKSPRPGCVDSVSCIHVISLKRESGRFSFHFREVFQKCIEYIGKLLINIREIS